MKPMVALVIFVCLSETSSQTPHSSLHQREKTSGPNKGIYSNPKMMDNLNLFSPRMDYDEWTPLGRGDPLKNDPTYDYVPPVLERVHYWMDPSKRTPDPPLSHSGVLIMGSRTESTFTTRPTTPRHQVFQKEADSRIDTSSLLDPFFKLMDMSQFNLNFNSNANNHYKPVPNRVQRPHFQPNNNKQRPQPPQALQRPPYTMLMPPPPPPLPVSQSATELITTHIPTVPERTQTQLTTAPTPPTSGLPLTTKNSTTTNPTMLANTENVFKPVAISMPGSVKPAGNVTEEVKPTTKYHVSGKKPERTTTDGSMVLPIVTMFDTHKKQPIRQTEQQAHPNLIQNYPTTVKQKPLKQSFREDNRIKQEQKEADSEEKYFTKNQTPWNRDTETRISGFKKNTYQATTAPPVTTTRANILTTDPMFKHYKQPSEPIRGPFYLIIQGHSKVKTYGASKNPINRLLTSNEIRYDDDEDKKRNSAKFERNGRRLRHEDSVLEEEDNNVENGQSEEMRSFALTKEDNLESLEETFGKSNGGSSKKRYLGSSRRRKRFVGNRTRRRLLSMPPEPEIKIDCLREREKVTEAAEKVDNLDLESLIAISDDYDPEDVANILLKQEGGQGSGFGNYAASIFSRSEKEAEEGL